MPRRRRAAQIRRLVMLDSVQKRLHARFHAHLRVMLVHLDVQVRLAPHFLGEQMADHGVGAATVVGQVHGEQARVAANELRT